MFEEDAAGVRAIQALSAEELRQIQMVEMAQQLYSSRIRILWNRMTSENSVENESEEAVLVALKAISQHRTSIVASHRLVFAENATEVVYLQAGRVVSHSVSLEDTLETGC